MLSLTLAFFFVISIAAMLGLSGIPETASGIAWVGFFFVVVFLAALIWHVNLGRRTTPPR